MWPDTTSHNCLGSILVHQEPDVNGRNVTERSRPTSHPLHRNTAGSPGRRWWVATGVSISLHGMKRHSCQTEAQGCNKVRRSWNTISQIALMPCFSVQGLHSGPQTMFSMFERENISIRRLKSKVFLSLKDFATKASVMGSS